MCINSKEGWIDLIKAYPRNEILPKDKWIRSRNDSLYIT